MNVRERLEGVFGYAEHPELLFTSTVLDVLQFTSHIQDNLSQI